MDDQQHALSALLGAAALTGEEAVVNWIVALAAVVAALDLPQRARLLRDAPGGAAAVAGVGLVAVAVVPRVRRHAAARRPRHQLADDGGRRRDGARPVVGGGARALGRRAGTGAVAGGLVPLLFPIVLTPVVGVTVVAVAARNGWWLPVLAAAVGAVPIAVAAAGRPLARRHWRLLSAAIGVGGRRGDDRRRRPRRLTPPVVRLSHRCGQ